VKFGETEKPHPTGAPYKYWRCGLLKRGAGEGIRTLDINLGKVAEYPLRVADIGWQFIIYRIN